MRRSSKTLSCTFFVCMSSCPSHLNASFYLRLGNYLYPIPFCTSQYKICPFVCSYICPSIHLCMSLFQFFIPLFIHLPRSVGTLVLVLSIHLGINFVHLYVHSFVLLPIFVCLSSYSTYRNVFIFFVCTLVLSFYLYNLALALSLYSIALLSMFMSVVIEPSSLHSFTSHS